MDTFTFVKTIIKSSKWPKGKARPQLPPFLSFENLSFLPTICGRKTTQTTTTYGMIFIKFAFSAPSWSKTVPFYAPDDERDRFFTNILILLGLFFRVL